ncbi:MAG TPA: hypothetical protein VEI97_02965, partial [bacterium]|nr:hypothetical protein [bacterium]
FVPPTPPGIIRVNLQPVYSPKGYSPTTIAFTSFEVNVGTGFVSDPEIYVVDASGGIAQNVSQNPGESDMWPVFGEGMAVVAAQSDAATGNTPGTPLTGLYPAGGLDPVTQRVELAAILAQASLAFRDTDTSGASGQDENWRMRDLPVVPQHVADPLTQLADELCFRSARSTKDDSAGGNSPSFTGIPRLQAYPGRVNINTAPRQVLRALFLAMFQGAAPTLDDVLNQPASSTPRVDGGLFSSYIILPDPATNLQRRFDALKIADQYAHQVVQYRKWLYNNIFLVSDDTVPNGFTESIDELSGLNYRANPHVPFDSDNNITTLERPYFDPAPPFRNIADLFKVALYFNYGNVTGNPSNDTEARLYEAVQGPEGPSWDAMPTAGTIRNARTVATWTWGPIYQTEIRSRYNGENAPGNGGTDELDPYGTFVRLGARDAQGNYSDPLGYVAQQSYRLFSADDFKWVAPYLTTRSYMYRIESRGVIRVEANQQFGSKMDITADKWWIVNMGDEAVVNQSVDGGDYDLSYPLYTDVGTFSQDVIANSGDTMHSSARPRNFNIVAYQEQPENGVPLTRRTFVPSF